MSGRSRADRVAELARLRAQGLPWNEIAERLGAKPATLRALWNDPDGSKQRERRKRYQGVCVQCGGPTDGCNGRAKAPLRCKWCVRGVVPPDPPDARRTVPVRLVDIRLDARLEAARAANRVEQGELERQQILFAALFPSDRVYFLSESARPILAEVAA